MINAASLALIRSFEGCELMPYRDSAGVPTVGFGHTKGVTMGMEPITRLQAERWLLDDVRLAEAAVRRLVTRPLSENQYGALVSWTFNLGELRLKHSTMLRRINSGAILEAADEMLKWTKARDPKTGELVTLAGLKSRRLAERALFLTPTVTKEGPP